MLFQLLFHDEFLLSTHESFLFFRVVDACFPVQFLNTQTMKQSCSLISYGVLKSNFLMKQIFSKYEWDLNYNLMTYNIVPSLLRVGRY